MSLHVQVLVEHLSFLPVSRLCNAFTQDRVLVNHSPVGPAHQLALGQILEYVFHRHEPEVKCEWVCGLSGPSRPQCAGTQSMMYEGDLNNYTPTIFAFYAC